MRVLLALPLCLFMHPSYPEEPLAGIESATQLVPPSERVVDKSLPNPSTHPVAFLEACLKRYDDKKIQEYNYTATKEAIARAVGGEPTSAHVQANYKTAKHPFAA